MAANPLVYVRPDAGSVPETIRNVLSQLPIRPQSYGAVADRAKTTGSVTSGLHTFTADEAVFSASDVGKLIRIDGASSDTTPLGVHRPLHTTIATYVSPTVVTLTDAAGHTVSSSPTGFGTDNADAFDAAASALREGDTLLIPPGDYALSRSWYISRKNYVTISGYGATIYVEANSRAALVVMGGPDEVLNDDDWVVARQLANYGDECENVAIHGVTFSQLDSTAGGSNLGLVLSWTRRCSLIDCRVVASNGNGIQVEHSIDPVVDRCEVSGVRFFGIFLYQSLRGRVINNVLIGGGTDITMARGIEIKQAYNALPSLGHYVAGNTLIDIGSNDYWIGGGFTLDTTATGEIAGPDVPGHEVVGDVTIEGNRLRRVSGSYAPGISAGQFAARWRIKNNLLDANGVAGIAVTLGTNGNAASGGTVGEGHLVKGNTFRKYDNPTGVLIGVGVRCKVRDNEFDDCATKYVLLASAPSKSEISLIDFSDNEYIGGLYTAATETGLHVATGALCRVFQCHRNTILALSRQVTGTTVYLVASRADVLRASDNVLRLTKGTGVTGHTVSFGFHLSTGRGRLSGNQIVLDAQTAVRGIQVESAAADAYLLDGNSTDSLSGSSATSRLGVLLNGAATINHHHYGSNLSGQILDNTGKGLGAGIRREVRGTAAPTSGTWNRGDMVINMNDATGQPAFWKCVASGTPGTWEGRASN